MFVDVELSRGKVSRCYCKIYDTTSLIDEQSELSALSLIGSGSRSGDLSARRARARADASLIVLFRRVEANCIELIMRLRVLLPCLDPSCEPSLPAGCDLLVLHHHLSHGHGHVHVPRQTMPQQERQR